VTKTSTDQDLIHSPGLRLSPVRVWISGRPEPFELYHGLEEMPEDAQTALLVGRVLHDDEPFVRVRGLRPGSTDCVRVSAIVRIEAVVEPASD
jgi:hypothetical protein